jgi:hypothetical protein
MKFELDEYHRNTPDEVLLDDLRMTAKRLGQNSITMFEYNENGRFSCHTLCNRFGKWNSALEKAGLEKTRTLNIPNDALFHNLEEVWVKLGRQPRYSEVLKPLSKYSVDTYADRFGTWRKALEAFVKYINDDDATSLLIENPKRKNNKPALSHKTTRNINWRLRFVVMRRDNFKCQSCGRSPATDAGVILHVDHKIAWANGGETVPNNLQTLCLMCNIGKSNI